MLGTVRGFLAGQPQVQVLDADTGTTLFTVRPNNQIVGTPCFSPDGQVLATYGASSGKREGKEEWRHEVKLWDAGTGKLLRTLRGHGNDIHALAFSPDGKRLASMSRADGTTRIWDVAGGQELLTLRHGGRSGGFTADGNRLVVIADAGVMIFDALPAPR
jgi:WD40 repeat protein